MAREFSGTGQYLTAATGFGLGANSPFWMIGRFWLDTLPAGGQSLFSLGINATTSNRRDVLWTTTNGGQVEVRSVSSAGITARAVSAYATPQAWVTVLAEWGGTTLRAVTVNNGTRVTDTTSNSLNSAPSQTRIGATTTAAALLDGRAAWIGVFVNAPTASDRAAALAGQYPPMIKPGYLLGAWNLAGVSSPEPQPSGGPAMVLTGSPTQVASPVIYLPRGRSMVVVASAGPPPTLQTGWRHAPQLFLPVKGKYGFD